MDNLQFSNCLYLQSLICFSELPSSVYLMKNELNWVMDFKDIYHVIKGFKNWEYCEEIDWFQEMGNECSTDIRCYCN